MSPLGQRLGDLDERLMGWIDMDPERVPRAFAALIAAMAVAFAAGLAVQTDTVGALEVLAVAAAMLVVVWLGPDTWLLPVVWVLLSFGFGLLSFVPDAIGIGLVAGASVWAAWRRWRTR